MQFASDTPTREFKVAGGTFKIIQPYAEGQTITAGEAGGLNQLLTENIRNLVRLSAEKMVKEGKSQEEIQAYIDERVLSYEMGARSAGVRITDRFEQEVYALACEAVDKMLQKKNIAPNKFKRAKETKDQYKNFVSDLLTLPKYGEIQEGLREEATRRLESAQALAELFGEQAK